jgi:hypothetical protein
MQVKIEFGTDKMMGWLPRSRPVLVRGIDALERTTSALSLTLPPTWVTIASVSHDDKEAR